MRVSDGALTLTAELLADVAFLKSATVSPDGRQVAYLVSEMGEEGRRFTELWCVEADGDSAPSKLATGLPRTTALRWAPDGSSLLYVARGQLHRIRPGGDPEELTAWGGGISDQIPLQDGRRAALIAGDESTEADKRREATGDDAMVWGQHLPYDRLRICDLETGDISTVSELHDRHVMAVAQRPDGGPLAVVSWACPADDPGAYTARLHVVDVDSGEARDLGPLGVEADSPVWWNDGETWHVAYLAVPPPGVLGLAVFDVVPPSDGAEAVHRDLTSEMNVCPVELVQVAGGPPLALFADGLDTAVYRLDPATSRFDQLFHRQGQLDTLTASRTGEVIAVQATVDCEPKDVYAGSLDGALRRLSDTQPALRRVRWGTQERISYRAADGLALDGLLVLPAGRTRQDGPFPLVTLVHGGPYWRFTDSLGIADPPSSQWLAASGYAVFLPNPRGSLGRGHALAASVAGAVGLAEWTDILSGIDVLIAEGVADPDRLGIGGWSHGGFMAAWAVGQTDRFKAAFMGAGICDWGLQAAVGELGAQESELSGSSGWDGVGPLQHDRLSPISYAERIKTPVLILHGEEDTNVPLGQSIYFQRALRRFGVEHELVVYPREGHGMVERGHQIDVMRRGLAWFDRWLSPADAP